MYGLPGWQCFHTAVLSVHPRKYALSFLFTCYTFILSHYHEFEENFYIFLSSKFFVARNFPIRTWKGTALMRLSLTYLEKIKHHNRIFQDTVMLYREAVFFADVCLQKQGSVITSCATTAVSSQVAADWGLNSACTCAIMYAKGAVMGRCFFSAFWKIRLFAQCSRTYQTCAVAVCKTHAVPLRQRASAETLR